MDVVHAFERVNGLKINYAIMPRRAGDAAKYYANAKKAMTELGWSAKYSIEDMCRDSWNWQSKNPKDVYKRQPLYMTVFWRSVWMALLATAVCLLLGYPVAYILSRMKANTAAIVSVLFILPMWMNFLLRTYAWRALLDNAGIINQGLMALGLEPVQFLYTSGAIIFGLVYNFLPFMILPIYSKMCIRDRIRTVWRSLGWIHLRMTNDIDTENKMPLNKPQLKKRIEEARDRLQKMIDNDFKEDG